VWFIFARCNCGALILFFAISRIGQAPERPLRLHAAIERARYCKVDQQVSSLLITFRVRLRNGGKHSIVIDQPIHPLLLVSDTLDHLRMGRYRFELNGPDLFANSPLHGESIPMNLSSQVFLRERETLEPNTLETVVPVVRRKRAVRSPSGLAAGAHYLRVVVQGQFEGTEKFVQAGSEPIKITVDRSPKLELCK
jgi:hypothetical protein